MHCSTGRGFGVRDVSGRRTCGLNRNLRQYDDQSRRARAPPSAKVKHYPPCVQGGDRAVMAARAGGRCTFVSSDHVSWGLERKGIRVFLRTRRAGPAERSYRRFGLAAKSTGLVPGWRSRCSAMARRIISDWHRKGRLRRARRRYCDPKRTAQIRPVE